LTSLNELAQESQSSALFQRTAGTWGFRIASKRMEVCWALLDVLFVLDFFFEVSQIEIPSKHKASTLLGNVSPLVPHFLQPCFFFYDCSIFSSFLELKGQNAATSLHSGNNANNSFHFPRDGKSATLQGEGTLQYQGKHGSLESNLSRRTKSSFIVSSLL
jgi:hypothetical protein